MALPIAGLHHLALRTTDLERAKQFYTQTLGFSPVFEAEGVIIVDAGGTPLGLRDADAQTPASDRFNPYRVGLDHLALTVPDVASLEDLKRHLRCGRRAQQRD
ncbi:MAG TPA: VOC family protein [Dehalococcoidia bacterium]|nr:VOC family protein [Dehalococcoidia bacterium]